jgi:Patatin-like phospholipase
LRGARISVIAVLIGAAIVFSFGWFDLNDNHFIRRSATFSPSVALDGAFGRWLTQRPDRQKFDIYPVVLVSADGGGIRAAFFTAMVLARLADACPQITQHIFGISGVSGGSVGAAVYAAAMKADPPNANAATCDFAESGSSHYQDKIASILSEDHLSPLLAKLLLVETVQQFLPFPVPSFDRQLGLEYSLEKSFLRAFGTDLLAEPLYALMPSKATPSLPYLFLNTTRVRDGRRLIMSPVYVKTEPHGGFDDWHLIDYRNGPPLSAAAGTSARFPFISPPGTFTGLNVTVAKDGTFPQDPDYKGQKDEYVDGGYFDNSGTPTLVEIYRQLQEIRSEAASSGLGDQRFSVHVIHIGNQPICDSSPGIANVVPCKETNYKNRSGLWNDAILALRAVTNVRDSRVEYGLRQLEQEVDTASQPKTDTNIDPRGLTEEQISEKAQALQRKIEETEPWTFDRHSTVQMRDQGIPVPLGWLLSGRAVAELRLQLKPLDAKVCERDRQTRFDGFSECELAQLLTDFVGMRK